MDLFDRVAIAVSGLSAEALGLLRGHSALRRSVTRDHAKISTLITRAGAGAPGAATRRREALLDDLVLLLNTYLSAEQKELFLPFEQYLADADLILELIHEQREIGSLLVRLGSCEIESEQWLEQLAWFGQRVRAHFQRVEEHLLPAMQKAIPRWDRDIMTARYRLEMNWSGAALRARLRGPVG